MAVDPHVIYNRYSDNLAPSASISLDGLTLEPGYDAEWICDGNIARPVRFQEATGRVLFVFDDPVAVYLPAIGHANFAAGLDVRLKAIGGGSPLDWTNPDFEYQFTIPEWRVGRYPYQPWADLTQEPNWGSYDRWALDIVGTNPVALTIGEIWLGDTIRRLNPDFREGRRPAIDQPRIEHRTTYKRLRSQIGSIVRSVTGTIPPTDDDVVQDILDWMIDADGRPFLFIPDGAAPESWWALHVTTRQELEDWLDHDLTSLELVIEEDGRGLEPTPSPLP